MSAKWFDSIHVMKQTFDQGKITVRKKYNTVTSTKTDSECEENKNERKRTHPPVTAMDKRFLIR